jgi:hypothetical protein
VSFSGEGVLPRFLLVYGEGREEKIKSDIGVSMPYVVWYSTSPMYFLTRVSRSLYLSGKKRFAAFCKSGVDDSSTGSVIIERPVRVTGSGIAASPLLGRVGSPTAIHLVVAVVEEEQVCY